MGNDQNESLLVLWLNQEKAHLFHEKSIHTGASHVIIAHFPSDFKHSGIALHYRAFPKAFKLNSIMLILLQLTSLGDKSDTIENK